MGDKLKFEDITTEFEEQDISNNKILSLFSYIGFLVLIPIFAAKDSRFAKFHANQGLVIIIAAILLSIISSIVGLVFGLTIYKIAIIGTIVSVIVNIIFWILRVVLFALCIYGIINACQGKAVKFPYFDKLVILK